ncbi:hypothetical protein B0A50_00558 [Salinomyces thailandicus]|uniref:Mitochondrial carrier protein PET8 n=1 Tax=Salinomyces thailandicus TaxID=706561 RepID=A0A4U0UFN4_9PEZI|nr:hypothetical protein B0A50_00558 [Salinomyces thailandica]
MSAIRLSFARAPSFRAAATRSFGSSRVFAAGKESALNREDRADEAESHKQDQLQKQKAGKGHWKDELASDSESMVKADRNELNNTKESISELQKESAKLAEKEQK